MSYISSHDCGLVPDMDPIKADIYSQFNSEFIEKEFKKLTEQAVTSILDQKGITSDTDSLNFPETEKQNKYIKSIKQVKGQVTAETADIDTNYTKITGDTVASTQSIASAIGALNATISNDSKFISGISETNGIVSATSTSFDSEIKNSPIAPSNTAVFNALELLKQNFQQGVNKVVTDLACNYDTANSHITNIKAENGKIIVELEPLATSLDQQDKIPTSKVVKDALTALSTNLDLNLINALSNLSVSDTEEPLTYVSSVSQSNGKIIVTRKPLPSIGAGTVNISVNGEDNKFNLNQSGNTEIELTIPTAVSQLANDAGYLTGVNIDNKVDKVEGKQLSSNDYSNAEKQKLAEIEPNAQKNKIETVKIKGGKSTYKSTEVELELTNYYNKSETISLLNTTSASLKADIEALDSKIDSVEADVLSDNVKNIVVEGGDVALAGGVATIELTDFYTKDETDELLDNESTERKADKAQLITLINNVEQIAQKPITITGGVVTVSDNDIHLNLTDYYNKTQITGIVSSITTAHNSDISSINNQINNIVNKPPRTVTVEGGNVTASDTNVNIELVDYYNKDATDAIVSQIDAKHTSDINTINTSIAEIRSDISKPLTISGGKVTKTGSGTNIELLQYYTKLETAGLIDSKISNVNSEINSIQDSITAISSKTAKPIEVDGGDVTESDTSINISLTDFYKKADVKNLIKEATDKHTADINTINTTISNLETEAMKPIKVDGGNVTVSDNEILIKLTNYWDKNYTASVINSASANLNSKINAVSSALSAHENKPLRNLLVECGEVIRTEDTDTIKLSCYYTKSETNDLVSQATAQHTVDIDSLKDNLALVECQVNKKLTIDSNIGKVTETSSNIKLELTGFYTKSQTIGLLNNAKKDHDKDITTIQGKLSTVEDGAEVNKIDNIQIVGGTVESNGKTRTIKLTEYYNQNQVDSKLLDTLTPIRSKLNGIESGAQVNKINNICLTGGNVSYSGTTATLTLNNYFTRAETQTRIQSMIDNSKADLNAIENKLTNVEDNAQVNKIESVIVKDHGIIAALPIEDKAVTIDLSSKLDVDPSKGLSKNDFTDTLLNKLNNIEYGAQRNVQPNWDETSSRCSAYIRNKPTIGNGVLSININGETTEFSANQTTDTQLDVSIPTKISDLSDDIDLVSKSELSNKVDKEAGKSLVSDNLITRLSSLVATADEKAVKISVDGTRVNPDSEGFYNISLAGKVNTEANKSLISNSLISKLEAIENNANHYVLPTASKTTLGGVKIGDNLTISNGLVSINKNNITQALGYTPVSLDSSGKVPANLLPGFVDDVIEGKLVAEDTFKVNDKIYTPEAGKLYIDIDTNISYRWSGSRYTEMSSSISLGETSSTAFRGDLGKIAYDHVSNTNNPHHITKSQIGLGNVENVSFENHTPSFTEASSLSNINSGEKVSVIFGKIKKAITSLIAHISDNNKHLTDEAINKINSAQSALSDAQINATNSGVTANKIYSYDTHISDSASHVSSSDKTKWNNKQDALSAAQRSAIDSGITKAKVEVLDSLNANKVTDLDKAKWNEAEPNKIDSITFNGAAQTITNKNVNIELSGSNGISIEGSSIKAKVDTDSSNILSVSNKGFLVKSPLAGVTLNNKTQSFQNKIINITLEGSNSIAVDQDKVSVKLSSSAGNTISVKNDGLYASCPVKSYTVSEQLDSYSNTKSINVGNTNTLLEGNTHITGFMYKKIDNSFVLVESISCIMTNNDGIYELNSIAGNSYIQGTSIYMTFNNNVDGVCKYVISYIGAKVN